MEYLATFSILVCREPVGERLTTIGIDIQAPGAAPIPEFRGPQDGSIDASTTCAQAPLPLFGGSLPFGISAMQRVTVCHQGFDLLEVLGQVPHHPGGLNG